MGRPVVLSNGQMFVGLDENGLVHDFYYPYVGLENLTNARSLQHKIGVWVNGAFRWTDDGSWNISVEMDHGALVGNVDMRSPDLNISIKIMSFVDPDVNALVRRVVVTNKADDVRDVRLFMHQVFQISRAGRADTAMYVPDDNYILDYKGRYCLLIAGKFTEGGDFDQFAVGGHKIEGKAGTFQDAEDGELSGNAVEHGGVDSVIRFKKDLGGLQSMSIDYWIVAAASQSDAQVIHSKLKYRPIGERITRVESVWRTWLETSKSAVDDVAEDYKPAINVSLLTIKAHCDSRGSILASGDSSIFNYGRDYYCYCWPRDAAYAIWPLIRLGQYEEAKLFFGFARDTMHMDGYLMHKYQPDRAIGSTWHPLLHGKHKELAIQEDETAIVLYMMAEYWRRTKDRDFIESFYSSFIVPCASFMYGFVDDAIGLPHASYDLWEQKFLTTTYTVSTVIAGLEAAAEMAETLEHPDNAGKWRRRAESMRDKLDVLYHPDGYFRKGYLLQENGDLAYDDTLDISNFYGPFMFAGLSLDDERLKSTISHVEQRLLNTSPIGGAIRYEHDGYFLAKQQYKGNPWVVCTMWLAQYYIQADDSSKAEELLRWALARAEHSGALSEQFDPETGFALGVTPLVWSHAELINTTLDLFNIQP